MARRSREEWELLVDESRNSGMTQADFCRERGLSVGALQYWMRKLREERETSGEPLGMRLLPLHVSAPAGTEGLEVLLPNGMQLRFPAATQPAYVASVLAALAA